jgi:peroxiredoxin
MKNRVLTISWMAIALACTKEPTATPTTTEPPAPVSATPVAVPAKTPGGLVDPNARAAVGAPAPDFALSDLDGKVTRLGDYRGKTVVLEWFNPECPFVQRAHTKGSLVDAADKHMQSGVVWLAVNSGAVGKQGHGVDTNRKGVSSFGLKHAVLLDESGQVGKAYGATNTPHLYVIDPQGVLVYRGAIDNSPDAERQSPEGGKLVNYVDSALGALSAGQSVETKETKAYGCSVKYASH